ncbi:MAG: hypothetical protein R2828_08895 [Saprospiraceae bacterium]
MKNEKIVIYLITISFIFALTLGMMDYETESLIHLFTSDPGNIAALLFYTGFFTLLGWTLICAFRGLKQRWTS